MEVDNIKTETEGDSVKLLKKAVKKTKRVLMILKSDTGIEESVIPTKIIFICNAGLVTGCSSSDLLNIFSKFGPVLNIVMIPKKSYSFLVYATKEDAQCAFNAVHGKVGFSDKGPLYLVFVEKAPPFNDPWSDCCQIEGLSVIKDFISEEQEKLLLESFDWDEGVQDSLLKHRQVLHFGYEFNYKTNNIDPDIPLDSKIPSLCETVARSALDAGLISCLPDQLTVNRYLPGQGIPPHTDTHDCCTETILSLSLGSGIVMQFGGPRGEQVPIWLPARSLLVMSGEARYCWTHGITPRHGDTVPHTVLNSSRTLLEGLTLVPRSERVSLTYRKTFKGPCSCLFPKFCDRKTRSINNQSDTDESNESFMSKIEQVAGLLESKLVHQVYEEIAGHFSETRHKPWPKVLQFVESFKSEELLLDLGCGNGKYLGQCVSSKWEIGADYSQNLLNIVVERGNQAVRCDLLNVPFKDASVSGIICIAALHHLSTEERRIASIKEMFRVLQVGGRFLVYVWAKDQKKKEMSTYLKQNKKNFKKVTDQSEIDTVNEVGEFGLPVHVNRTQFKHQDVLVPWKLKQGGDDGEDKELKRFYHVFEEGELEELVNRAGGLEVLDSYYDQGNWCCIARKI